MAGRLLPRPAAERCHLRGRGAGGPGGSDGRAAAVHGARSVPAALAEAAARPADCRRACSAADEAQRVLHQLCQPLEAGQAPPLLQLQAVRHAHTRARLVP